MTKDDSGEELPAVIREHMDVLADGLRRLADGAPVEDVEGDLQRALGLAVRAAYVGRAADEQAGAAADFGAVIANNLRRLRAGAGWTQQQLADAMQSTGLDWKRITVAEVERGVRRVSLDELLTVAALYAVPMVGLLIPWEADHLRLPDGRSLTRDEVLELLVGPEGDAEGGGPDWPLAAQVAGAVGRGPDWRPASALHERGRRRHGTDPTP